MFTTAKQTENQTAKPTTKNGSFFVGGGSAPFFQAKLTVNQPDDAHEQEADAVADQVMRMPAVMPSANNSDSNSLVAQRMPLTPLNGVMRKCSKCAEKEEEKHDVHRKESGGGDASGKAAPSIVSDVLSSGSGQAMDGGTRQFMESRFGQDFSGVRIHTGSKAAESAGAIQARAYTSGRDVVFGSGEYQPASDSGRRLLAHELVHVGQQGSGTTKVQRDSVYEETPSVTITNRDHSGHVTNASGTMNRAEYRSESDRQAHTNPINQSSVNVQYNEAACQLIVPLTIRFINQNSANRTSCGNISGATSDPVTPVSQDVFTAVKQRFMREIPQALNGWYTVVLDGENCGACREIPVSVQFTEVSSATADRTVIVTGNQGRSYVSGDGQTVALCGDSGQDTDTLIHEAGHFALGWGDEYHETEGSRPRERERLGQYSRMAQDAPARLLEFHERHFAFASAFMRSVYPRCNPRLRRTRSSAIEFTIPIGLNLFNPGARGSDFGISLGLQLGIPLMDMRRLSLTLGPNFTYLVSNQSFLAGVRAGLEARSTLGHAGSHLGTAALGFRAFAEGGARFNFMERPILSQRTSAYLEGGAGIDLRFNSSSILPGLEVAGGTLDLGNAESNTYFRIGLRLGGSF